MVFQVMSIAAGDYKNNQDNYFNRVKLEPYILCNSMNACISKHDEYPKILFFVG